MLHTIVIHLVQYYSQIHDSLLKTNPTAPIDGFYSIKTANPLLQTHCALFLLIGKLVNFVMCDNACGIVTLTTLTNN